MQVLPSFSICMINKKAGNYAGLPVFIGCDSFSEGSLTKSLPFSTSLYQRNGIKVVFLLRSPSFMVQPGMPSLT